MEAVRPHSSVIPSNLFAPLCVSYLYCVCVSVFVWVRVHVCEWDVRESIYMPDANCKKYLHCVSGDLRVI